MRPAPIALPISQKTALIECSNACRKSTEPNALGPALVAEVLHLLAVLDAVALVDEARVDRVLARVERGRARHDLEGRARRVEAVGGAVQQRRGRAAGGADVVDPREVALDQVRVVGRPRGHHQHLPGARVERDHRAALARELLHRHALRARLDRQPDVVALDRRAADLVERRLEDGAEVRVRAGQVVVQRRLEPRARARLRRVADEVREEAALRVAAQVELLAADLLDPVRRRGSSRRRRGSGRA